MLAGSVNPFYHRIYRVVGKIPKGRVATYGIVARLAGRPGAARTWLGLSALPEENDVPWWRVINAAGRISLAAHDHNAVCSGAAVARGRALRARGAVSLGSYGWPAESYNGVPSQTRAASSRRSRRLKACARSAGRAAPASPPCRADVARRDQHAAAQRR